MGLRQVPLTVLGLATLAPATAWAADIAFSLTTSTRAEILCTGPFLRTSSCEGVLLELNSPKRFYTAEDNFLNPYGPWTCSVFRPSDAGNCGYASRASVDFCAQRWDVQLVFNGSSLTVNQPSKCGLASARAVLAQDGEDASATRDVDAYDYAGKPGETVDVRLDVDGSGGGVGHVATLRVLNSSGGSLDETSGPLPLQLRATLDGPSTIVVARAAAQGDAFRGNYVVEVAPLAGGVGARVLRPRENVEE